MPPFFLLEGDTPTNTIMSALVVLAITGEQASHSDVAAAKKDSNDGTVANASELAGLAGKTFPSATVVLGDDNADVNEIVETIAELLPGGAALSVRLLPGCNTDLGDVKLALFIGGFMDVEEESEKIVVCKKAAEVAEDVVKVTLPSANETIWKVTEDGADDELVDEDDLLQAPGAETGELAKDMDCGTDDGGGKRRACKNCSCGLREMLEKDIEAGKDVPKSACGSCHKGDAFRCATCPFLGKPAFETGQEKLVLKIDDADTLDQVVPADNGGGISFDDDPIF